MTENFDDLFKDIQDYLNNPEEEASVKHTADKAPEYNDKYTPALHARIEALTEELKRLNLPHIIAVNYAEAPGEKKDADDIHAMRRSTLIIANIRKPVCELMAMAEIAQLPHEFAHMVLDAAEKMKMLIAMGRMFTKLFGDDDNG